MPPAELDDRVPQGAEDRVMQGMYAAEVEAGTITPEEAERATSDSVEIARQLDDEGLIQVNRDVSDKLHDMDESWAGVTGDPSLSDEQKATFEAEHDEAENAYMSVGRALESLPYVDADRAEGVYGKALQDPELNAEGLVGVAKGLSRLTLVKGETTLPMWEEAEAAVAGDSDKAELITLAAQEAATRLQEEITAMKQDPEADSEAIQSDEKLFSKLQKFAGGEIPDLNQPERTGQTERTGEAEVMPPSEEQRREAAKRFEELFDRNGLAGDGRRN